MNILWFLVSGLISLGGLAFLVTAQMRRYRKLSEHPWRDVFSHKLTMIVYCLLRLLVIFALVRGLFRQDFESVVYCALVLVLFGMPMVLENRLQVELSPVMEVVILLFIYAAEILGEVENYYTLVPGWDTALHTMNGFLCAAIGFALVDMLNRSESVSLKLSPFFVAVVAFCFSMTVGVIWEFMEYSADTFLGLDAQKDFVIRAFHSVTLDVTNSQIPVGVSDIVRTVIETADGQQIVIEGGYLDIGIIDTMKDLMVNCVGALIFSLMGYLGLKRGKESPLARAFVPLVKTPKDILREAGREDVPKDQ